MSDMRQFLGRLNESDPKLACKIEQNSQVDDSGCWLWTGQITRHGYGVTRWEGRNQRVHRLIWQILNGRLRSVKILVCHKCDVRNCFNPAHLFTGSHGDNARDAVTKGRHWTHVHREKAARNIRKNFTPKRGEASNFAKLTEDEVIAMIRHRSRFETPRSKLAILFNTSYNNVWNVFTGVSWRANARVQRELARARNLRTRDPSR